MSLKRGSIDHRSDQIASRHQSPLPLKASLSLSIAFKVMYSYYKFDSTVPKSVFVSCMKLFLLAYVAIFVFLACVIS